MKRLFDIFVSGVGLLFIFPIIGVLAVLVAKKLGRPVFFRQPRPGRDGKVFDLIKFRSMTDERDESGQLLSDEIRLTKFGKWLRGTSLDELPSLWNVFCGNMSLVGPRPLLVDYLDHYSEQHARRHEVRPGFTGWAQVKGRNSLGWSERFDLDVWYVENQSFWLDLKILFMTVKTVLSKKGVSPEGRETMPKFEGYGDEKTDG
ncbi:MAG: sugar transferase EpsL [Verrucomicrobiales bacterium]|jgi:sugar transferase EpsL